MADTSELLRLCDEILDGIPTSNETLGEIHAQVTVARALKSRLQAEAQAPASVLTRDDWAKIIYNAMSVSLDEKITWEQVQEAAKKQPWQAKSMNFIYDIVNAVTSRLTVGAPAPAPTTPTRDAIRKVLERDVSSADETADAILALFARQGL